MFIMSHTDYLQAFGVIQAKVEETDRRNESKVSVLTQWLRFTVHYCAWMDPIKAQQNES